MKQAGKKSLKFINDTLRLDLAPWRTGRHLVGGVEGREWYLNRSQLKELSKAFLEMAGELEEFD